MSFFAWIAGFRSWRMILAAPAIDGLIHMPCILLRQSPKEFTGALILVETDSCKDTQVLEGVQFK